MSKQQQNDRETDRAMWSIACIIASLILGGLMLAVNYCREFTPWI